ncbi:MAG: hypothetical protein D4R80_05590 [Deltaproteobacteria bacterium]|nr:MAG: hypothetical protein D4R80_05590 [Deltaproteobacteria bacterium]
MTPCDALIDALRDRFFAVPHCLDIGTLHHECRKNQTQFSFHQRIFETRLAIQTVTDDMKAGIAERRIKVFDQKAMDFLRVVNR